MIYPASSELDKPLPLIPAGKFHDAGSAGGRWIVEKLARPGSGWMLYARQGIGKTRLSLQLAHSLIAGDPFLIFPVHQTGPVIFLQVDMAEAEWEAVLAEAFAAGLQLKDGLYTLTPGAHAEGFNVLNACDLAGLRAAIAEIRPVALIVDTANEAYSRPQARGNQDINKEVQEVLRAFRKALPNGLFCYVQHERKSAVAFRTGAGDSDAYSGPSAWERFPATSTRLVERSGVAHLHFAKTRYTKLPYSDLALERTENGFFRAVLDHRQLLELWPDCLPTSERELVLTAVCSKMDVYRDIGSRTGAAVDTVKKAHQRATERGCRFPWEELACLRGDK